MSNGPKTNGSLRALEIVETLSDAQAVSILKRLHQTVYQAVPYEEVFGGMPDDSMVREVADLPPDVKRIAMDAGHSVPATRAVLRAFAQDEALAPLVVEAWSEIENDDSLFVESVVAIGLIANLTLFLATTSGRFTFKHGVIEKEAAGAEIIREVLRPLTEFVKLRAGPGS